MLVNLITLFFLFVTISSATAAQGVIVQLPYGLIQGHIRKSYAGNDYYGFQEIPYAAPPVGEYRFKEPRNPEPWDGVRDGTKNTKQCIQDPLNNFPIDPSLEESEDCLFINVFSPKRPGANSSLPVFLYIHGGGFLIGSANPDIYNPARFIDENIMVVTMNYRVGVLGFLATGDDVIPGNLGLKDQLFAMKWVQSYIHLFGGDPAKVTIGGQSGGSYSASFHLVGENTEGLFRGVIMASGSAMSPSTYSLDPRTNAFELGRTLDENFKSNKSEDLLELLLKASPKDITTASDKVIAAFNSNPANAIRLVWVPVIENENAKNPLLLTPMHEAYMTGKFVRVPVLLGYNSEEFLAIQGSLFNVDPEVLDKDPSVLVFPEYHISAENATIVGNKLRQIYTDTSFSENNASFIKYLSDAFFTNSIIRQAELASEYVPIYLYQFSYEGTLGMAVTPNRYAYPGAEGAGHGEEVVYLWDHAKPTTLPDILAMERVILFWSVFVRFLNPTPTKYLIIDDLIWPTVTSDNIQFFDINAILGIETDPRNYSKVKSLLMEYMQPPYIVF